MTLPVSTIQAVLGKFFAAWIFTAIALVLTFPIWITVNYLGSPDNGVIFAGYVGSFLMAGAFLSIGSFVSALTRNQVIAFVIAAATCFIFMMSGLEPVQSAFRGWASPFVVTCRIIKFLDALRCHYQRCFRSEGFYLSVIGHMCLFIC